MAQSVFVTQAINPCVLSRSLAAFHVVPYDAYCPSVQSLLLRRTCKKYGLYHVSITSMKEHSKVCGIQHVVAPVRPVRITARRQREMMAIIQLSHMTNLRMQNGQMKNLSTLMVSSKTSYDLY